jgi:hypothetical protein
MAVDSRVISGPMAAGLSSGELDYSRPLFGLASTLGCILLLLLWTGPAAAASSNGSASSSAGRTGISWQGEPGITETVGEIMRREAESTRISGTTGPRVIPFRRIPGREFLPEDPGSAPVSHTPAGGRRVASSGMSLYTPQTLGAINFTGATLSDTLAFPPDSMGAIGPTQYIVAVNGRIRSFDKTTGLADGVLNVGTNTFFASVMTGTPYTFTSDPRIRYDRLSGRWFIIMIDVPGGSLQPNHIMIAVSSGATITSISNFTFFYFLSDATYTYFADYPTLGIDANALYIGANMFDSGGNFVNTTAYVVQKSSILGAGSVHVTAFPSLIGSDGPDTPQGVDNYDPLATVGYFIGTSDVSLGRLILLRVTNPGSTSPTLSGNIAITVPDTYPPLLVPHKGSTGGTNGYLDALDDRLFAAHIRNGELWTAHNLAVAITGVASGSGDRDGSRWYEITNLDTTPVLHQSGTVYDSVSATNPLFYWIPSIMVSGQGHAALGFSVAGANHYADAATVGRLASDTLGTTETPLLYTSSSTAYNPTLDHGGPYGRRWGDYSYTSLDPDDDMTMWTIQEFCNATNSYGVQVVKLLAPPPATPVSASPSTVDTNQSNVDVVITGMSVAGSGFFEPGVTFDKHISATIPGVTVNSVTYTDPTHVTVNITTGSSAGSVAVTVTNPDGQSSTSSSAILTVSHPCPTITVNPSTLSNATYNSSYSQTFTATGGTPPYIFGLIGSIPTGMTFSTDTLSGTPSQVGSFSFTVAAMDSDSCTGSRDYTLNVINSTAVRIESSPSVYYESIQAAYDHPVTNGDVIQAQAIDFFESPVFDQTITFTLSGGYDPAFDTPPSSFTSIMGTLTIAQGTVTIENIVIH